MKRGFTLIELLVVVGVIAVLTTASMVIINPSEQLQKSRDAERKQDLRQIQIALQAYEDDKNRFPNAKVVGVNLQEIDGASWGEEWQPYMAKVPKDPLSTQSYYYESYEQSYRLYAKLERCLDPQTIKDINCATAPYNYVVTSSNEFAIAFGAPTPTPPPPPTPTSTPIPPPPPTPTSTPIPPPTPTPTPRPFKYVFVTSGAYNGDLETQGVGTGLNPGLDGGDNICETLADNSTLPSVRGLTWAAWLSTSTTDARDRITWTGEYHLVDGTTVIANNKSDLTDTTIDNKLDRNEQGSVVDSNVWTGTYGSGVVVESNHCNNWESDSNSDFGQYGKNTWVCGGCLNGWSSWVNIECNKALPLYCFEQ